MKFLYERFPSQEGVIYYPTLNLSVVNPTTEEIVPNYKVLVDSGATASVFHAGIGELIGLNVGKGRKVPMYGVVSGEGEQFLHRVNLNMGGSRFELEVGFSYDLTMPFGLLGQRGFFEQFRVCFDLPKREFEITPKGRNSS